MPIFLNRGCTVMPFESIGTHMSVLLACGPPASLADAVFASRHIQSACVPLVVHILLPLTTYSSPRRTAVVFNDATSLPALLSDTPKHATKSPRTLGARKVCFT
jgi:hypothetical protein